ncbi:hypothetical protein [Alkaliphilus peptidifermentans]|uniref:Uncharacterized protein n=1 Tax=Alkaliphilus peptidifermentans DSM 18978 TaxID=1120976 RepID=A0A1G5KS95_9FIRM|nr:hypothetical protein [Alkaliphilus peptidifermentans]SCZ02970.1 hypothetical protein SAMN03080606_03695 [Alkaliphilus peptidifermentans DSM 18978]
MLVEWIDIFYKEVNLNNIGKNDYFLMAAMIDNDESTIEKCLKKFEWGFTPSSFEKSTFWKGYGDKGEITFTVGNEFKDFEEV